MRRSATLAALVLTAAACSAADSAPHAITATSDTYIVVGQYWRIDIDRVVALTTANGRIVVRGTPHDIAIDTPGGADLQRPTRHWTLVTDAHTQGRRALTFAEAESVTDFTLDLPEGEAPVHFRVFERQGAGEVLVFACGDSTAGPASLFGYVTIGRKSANVRSDSPYGPASVAPRPKEG